MKRVIRIRSFSLSSNPFPSQIRHLSSPSKSPRLCKKNRTTQLRNQAEKGSNGNSLFKEITEILQLDDAFTAQNASSDLSISSKAPVEKAERNEKLASCTQGVCRTADDNILGRGEAASNLEGTNLEIMGTVDVSPVVHEITKIVRAEDDLEKMEERLRNLNIRFNSEIVDKVLKRCFKVPHLAFRFFNWVKGTEGFQHTTTTYNTMLYVAGEVQDLELVDELVKQMETSCQMDIKTWTILIFHYGRANLISKALLIFEKLRRYGCEPDATAYKTMIRSLCAAGKADIAMEFYKEMVQKEMVLDISSYKMLMNCIAKSGDIAVICSVAGDMITIAQRPEHEVCGCVLKSFCISGRVREALEYIRDLKNKKVAFFHEYFEILVKGLCRADRIADALEVVEIMKRRQSVEPKVYEVVINGYLRKKDISKALEIFQNIKESGQLPTISTYTELMQHLFQINEYEKGCELYHELLKTGIKLDSIATTAMVAGHVRQNHVSAAWKEFRSMQDKGVKPTWKFYSVFIKELCRVKRTDEIFKVLNEMRVSEVNIGDEIFNMVVSYLEKNGDCKNLDKLKKLQRIYKFGAQESEVGRDDVSEGGQLNVECKQTETGDIGCYLAETVSGPNSKEGFEEVRKILSSSSDWSSIQEVLEKCNVQFTAELVLEILCGSNIHGNTALHFFSWIGKQPGYIHTTETYNMAIKIAGRGKDFKHMRNLFYEMRRKDLATSNTWTIMVMQYGRTGLTEIALRLFKEMKTDGLNPTGSSYKYLIICLCGRKGRKVDAAVKLFNEMIDAGHIPDKELVETYLCCLCDVGKLLDARKCVDYLRKVGFTAPLSCSLYVRALCRAGRLEEARQLVDETEDERPTLEHYTYGSIVHGLLQRGLLDEALTKVDALKQAGVSPTAHVYTSLIVYFFKEKKIEKALEIFNKMRAGGCEPTIVTYSALIRGYMNTEKVEDAWNIFNHMKFEGPFPDFKTYSMFIPLLCRVGRSEEALQLLSDMRKRGIVPSSVNFRTVFHGLNREGKHDLARFVMQQKLNLMNKRKFLT